MITFRNQLEPASNYNALLQTANAARTGPDLESIVTGYMVLQNQNALVKLNAALPKSVQQGLYELQYSSDNYNVADGIDIAPDENQAYIGYYNKTLFKKAGITSLPTDWSQLYADCSKLKAIHVTPIEYGNLNLGTPQFYVAMDLDYLLAGVLTSADFAKLYDGQIPWTSPKIVHQVEQWHKLYAMGCTNSDALTQQKPLAAFESGKAAIADLVSPANISASVSRHTGVMPMPFNPTPERNIVYSSGGGIGATTYGKHVGDAVAFLRFVDSPAGQRIIGERAQPALAHVKSSYSDANSDEREITSLATSRKKSTYFFIDNLLQASVYSTAQTVLPLALVGRISAKAAMTRIEDTVHSLPASEKHL